MEKKETWSFLPALTKHSQTLAIGAIAGTLPLVGQAQDQMYVPRPAFVAEEDFFAPRHPLKVNAYSWTAIESPPTQEIKLHDIISIIVDDKSEVTANAQFNRTRSMALVAELKEFIRLSENGTLTNAAADTQPTIDGALNETGQSKGSLIEQEGIRSRIAARVVDIRPNGNIILEAHKRIQTNRDIWEHTLTGEIASRQIKRDYTALSENIADLKIKKTQLGKVYRSANQRWGTRLWEKIFPF